ncbi:hypothetical protein ATCC90586_008194 [Pythium insidiosum]|nr:hypothetical protein ATCC90586_008194 [Pythium insidiosum]
MAHLLCRTAIVALLLLLTVTSTAANSSNVPNGSSSKPAADVKADWFDQQRGSIVTVNADCGQVNVSLTNNGVAVSCNDRQGKTLTAINESVLTRVVVQLPNVSTVTFADSDSTSLRELIFNSVNFANPMVKLDLPASVETLRVVFTNANDVMLANETTAAASQLNVVTETTTITRLDAQQYANAMDNFDAKTFVESTKPIFVGECSNDVAPEPYVARVCSVTPLPKDIPITGKANSTSLPKDNPDPTSTKSIKKTYKTEMFVAIAVAAVSSMLSFVLVICLYRVRRKLSTSTQAVATENHIQPRSAPLLGKVDVTDDELISSEGAYAAMTRRQTASSERFTTTNSRGSSSQGTKTVTTYEVHMPRLNMNALQLGQKISQGAYGEVFRGHYDGKDVAIKRLSSHHRADHQQVARFKQEAQLMASISHERIITFIGIAWDNPSELHIVTEFMEGGDLRALLARQNHDGAATGFDRTKIKIAYQVIEGLAYLHALRPQILHRDLKSRNVLLSSHLDAKLIDFGVSRERVDSTMTMGVGTLRWMAPEVMRGGRYGETADVFSFGVILSEIDTHNLPYWAKGRELSDATIITQVSSGQLCVDFTALADREVVQIARDCMAFHAKDRPTAAVVAMRMRSVWDRFNADMSFNV